MSESSTDKEPDLWLTRGARRYAPGEVLEGGCDVRDWMAGGLTSLEIAVLWLTAGVGEEDLCVHHFLRFDASDPRWRAGTAIEFEVPLPQSPLSYDGQIVQVCWLVRLRGFFPRGRQRLVETPFTLELPTTRETQLATSGEST